MILYLASYSAHAATTRTVPGEIAFSVGIITLITLFFPAGGVSRGLQGTEVPAQSKENIGYEACNTL